MPKWKIMKKTGMYLAATATAALLSLALFQTATIAQSTCTPNQNTFRDGLVLEECPNGTTSPTFNAYKNYEYKDYTRFDERNFLQVRKLTNGAYVDNVSVLPGDTLRFNAYLHNNCDPSLNDGGNGVCVAHNVETFVRQFLENNQQNFQTTPSLKQTITQTFSASNATPRQVTDDVVVRSADNQNIVLEYIPNTALYYNALNPDRTYKLYARELFGNGAQVTSVNRNGTINNDGDFFGSSAYITYFNFDVIIKRPPTPPPSAACVNLQITNVVNNADGSINFSWTTNPTDYADKAVLALKQGPGTLEMLGNNRARLSNFNKDTVVTVFVPGSEQQCKDELPVAPYIPQNPCYDLVLTPDKFNPLEPSHRFSVQTNPNNYNELNWKLTGPNTDVTVMVAGDKRSAVFTNLGPDHVVSVFATGEVAPGKKCEDEARSQLPPPTEYCLAANLKPNHFPANGGRREFVFEYTPNEYKGDFIWRTVPANVGLFADGSQIGNAITTRARRVVYRGGQPGTQVIVEAKDPAFRSKCTDIAIARNDVPADENDNLVKTADISLAKPGDTVTYNITYKKDPFFQSDTNNVTIFDTIGKEGFVSGDRGGKIVPVAGSMRVNLPVCTGLAATNCYTGSILNPNGITLQHFTNTAPVNISYKATVNTVINAALCENLTNTFCGEKFTNEAFDTENHFATWTITVLCPAFRSFGFGDIFLEDTFKGGIDTLKCNGKPNTQGIVVTPTKPTDNKIVSTGEDASRRPEHGECKNSDIFPNLSSALCELQSQLSDEFTNNPLRTLTRNAELVCTNALIRDNVTLRNGSISELRQYANPNNTNELVICANTITTTGPITIDYDGPVTLVAKKGLTINGDILYSKNTKITPSVVAVTNGAITTNKTKKLSGIYIALPNSDNLIAPMVINNDTSRPGAPFEVVGSLIGTSFEVQNNDFNIIYDLGRFLITEPSVLNDALDFIQEVTVNQ